MIKNFYKEDSIERDCIEHLEDNEIAEILSHKCPCVVIDIGEGYQHVRVRNWKM